LIERSRIDNNRDIWNTPESNIVVKNIVVVGAGISGVLAAYYYIRRTYHDDNGKPPIYRLNWDYIFTKNEYLLELLK